MKTKKRINIPLSEKFASIALVVAIGFMVVTQANALSGVMSGTEDVASEVTSAANEEASGASLPGAPDTQSDGSENGNEATKEEAAANTPQPSSDQPKVAAPPAQKPAAIAATPSPRGLGLYVSSELAQYGAPAEISSQPIAMWLGNWVSNPQASVAQTINQAKAQSTIATFVVYNIPGRDCGSHSAGGLANASAYGAWIRQVAAGIGANRAIVIIEPDALSQIDCLSGADQAARYAMLSDAVAVFASQTKASIYLDAGHSNWISAGTMTDRLKKANIAQARGFALNVSNFETTENNKTYGNQLARSTGKNYIIDTSRNGNGANGNEWCNPSGRALGVNPTTNVGGSVDAYLWVKTPGHSDGQCNGGPSAGAWWPEYAQGLVANRR